jgi:hypothetical protein
VDSRQFLLQQTRIKLAKSCEALAYARFAAPQLSRLRSFATAARRGWLVGRDTECSSQTFRRSAADFGVRESESDFARCAAFVETASACWMRVR